MILVSGIGWTRSAPLGIVLGTMLLLEASPDVFVVLKEGSAGYYPAGCSEGLPNPKEIIFRVH